MQIVTAESLTRRDSVLKVIIRKQVFAKIQELILKVTKYGMCLLSDARVLVYNQVCRSEFSLITVEMIISIMLQMNGYGR